MHNFQVLTWKYEISYYIIEMLPINEGANKYDTAMIPSQHIFLIFTFNLRLKVLHVVLL